MYIKFFSCLDILTKRKALLKLSLDNNIPRQLEQVASSLYDFKTYKVVGSKRPAKNQDSWVVTDEYLFKDARSSYLGILRAFSTAPRIYRFQSTQQIVDRENQQWFGEADGEEEGWDSREWDYKEGDRHQDLIGRFPQIICDIEPLIYPSSSSFALLFTYSIAQAHLHSAPC